VPAAQSSLKEDSSLKIDETFSLTLCFIKQPFFLVGVTVEGKRH